MRPPGRLSPLIFLAMMTSISLRIDCEYGIVRRLPFAVASDSEIIKVRVAGLQRITSRRLSVPLTFVSLED